MRQSDHIQILRVLSVVVLSCFIASPMASVLADSWALGVITPTSTVPWGTVSGMGIKVTLPSISKPDNYIFIDASATDSSGLFVQIAAEMITGSPSWAINWWYLPVGGKYFISGNITQFNVASGNVMLMTAHIVSAEGGGYEWVYNVTDTTTKEVWGGEFKSTTASTIANAPQEVYAFESNTNTTKYFSGKTITSNPSVEYYSDGTWLTSTGPNYVMKTLCDNRFGIGDNWVGGYAPVPSWWVEEATSQVSTLPYGEVIQGYQLPDGVNSCSANSSPELWAKPPITTITVDTSVAGNVQSGTTLTVTLPTIKSGDMVLVFVAAAGDGNTLSCSTAHLGTLTERAYNKGNPTAFAQTAEFYAVASGGYTNEAITCTDSSPNNFSVLAVSLTPPSGTSIGFDPNNSVWVSDDPTSESTSDSLTISTTNTNDMVIGMFLAKSDNQIFTNGTGYDIGPVTNSGPSALMEYKAVTSAQQNLAVDASWSISQYHMMIADAVTATAPTLGVDGSNSARSGSVTSVSAPLTTQDSGDLVYVACLVKPLTSSATVSSVTVSSPTLGTYTQRGSVEEDANPGDILYAYTFYAVSTGTLNSESITCSATLSSGTANMGIYVWGISGADTSSPFDSNSGNPDSWTCYSDTVTINLNCLSFTTENPNDMIIGIFGQLGSGTTFTNAAGYTTIAYNDGGPSGVAIYQVVSSAGTYAPSVTSSNSGAPNGAVYVAIGDAIVA